MRLHVLGILGVFVLALLGSPAFADIKKGPGFDAYVPAGWTTKSAVEGGEAFMIAIAPGSDAGALYTLVEAKNFDAAMKLVDAILGKLVSDAKLTKGSKVTVNGMPGLGLGGTAIGNDDKKPVSLGAVLLQADATHIVLVVGMVHTDAKARYKAELEKVLTGVTKAK